MEDVKKKFKDDLNKKIDPKGKANVVGDESLSSNVKSKFEMDLDNFLIPKNKFHVDPRGKLNVFACDRSLSSKSCF
ncbi:hypothetical protein Hanom_Chr12g01137301 [Helianthus anomalus]